MEPDNTELNSKLKECNEIINLIEVHLQQALLANKKFTMIGRKLAASEARKYLRLIRPLISKYRKVCLNAERDMKHYQ